jgi:ribosome recycling factor
MSVIDEILLEAEAKMEEVIESTKREFALVRTGRASIGVLERVMIDYYGTPTPINKVATITVPEARLLVIQPWDKRTISDIEKAIQKADLGLVPNNDGNVIRLPFPALTEERRKELVKRVGKIAEAKRVAVRNIRREANDSIKALEKNSSISEDDMKKSMDDVQKLTDKYVALIDELLGKKSDEIMEI